MSNPTSNFGWQMPTATDLVTDLPADFEVFGQAVDTSLADLRGGTTGQVLKKNTNTDMDFVWAADAAGMTNPMTTTGDIIYSSSGSTPARLGIGTTGQVLNVAAGIPAWTTPTSPSASYSLLNSGGTALTGATTITVSGISGINDLIIVMNAASTANASGANFGVRVNGLTTNVYYGVGSFNNADSPYDFNMFSSRNYGNTTSYLPLAKVTSNSATASGSMTLSGCNSTGIKPHISIGAANPGASYGQYRFSLQGYIDATSAITSVSVFSDDGNFDAGTLYVYGA